MKVILHPIPIVCPKCNKDANLLNIFISRKANILIKAICVLCNENIEAKFNLLTMISTCAELDVLLPFEASLEDEKGNK